MGSFADQLAAFVNKSKDTVNEVVREVVLETGSRVIDRSPIDTGNFVSNWNYGLELRDTTTTEKTDVRTLNYADDIPKKAWGFLHFVSNSMPYALRLEYGFTGTDSLGRVYNQAPRGMAGLTTLEFPQIIDLAVARATGRVAANIYQGGAG